MRVETFISNFAEDRITFGHSESVVLPPINVADAEENIEAFEEPEQLDRLDSPWDDIVVDGYRRMELDGTVSEDNLTESEVTFLEPSPHMDEIDKILDIIDV